MNNKKPKILFFTSNNGQYGGSENFWFEAVMHPQMTMEFSCFLMMPKGEFTLNVNSRLKNIGVETEFYDARSRDGLWRAYHYLQRKLNGAIYENQMAPWFSKIDVIKPDLVWFNLQGFGNIYDLNYPIQMCRAKGIPYWLILQHAFEHEAIPDHATHAMDIIRGAARFVYIADRNKNSVEKACGWKLANALRSENSISQTFLSAGEEIANVYPIVSDGPARFINVARFDPTFKGQHILLEILADTKWSNRDWTLTFQGGGPYSCLFTRLVEFYGLPSERINIRERIADVKTVLAESDLMLMPSLSEGTPYALVEGMACGRPAVVTPIGGMPELIQEGFTGWVACSTEVSDYAESMERAWTARSLWREFGERARSYVNSNHNTDHTLPKLIEELKRDVNSTLPNDGDNTE